VTQENAFRIANQLDDECRDKAYRVERFDEFSRQLKELDALERRQRNIQAFVQFHHDVVITTEQGYQAYQEKLNNQLGYHRQQDRDYLRQQDEVKRQLDDAEDKKKHQTALLPKWQSAQKLREALVEETEIEFSQESDISKVQTFINQSLTTAKENKRVKIAKNEIHPYGNVLNLL
jgi:hypothetical protein